jgi:predicted RecA/RadA family phage recombinase
MATNMVHDPGNQLEVVQASVASGDPIVIGIVPGVALTSSETTTNKVTLKTDGVFNLSVKGIDGGGNSAVAAGDIIYHVQADTPKLSKKATGVRFGYALDPVTSAATTTIRVKIGY